MSDNSKHYYLREDQRGDHYHSEPGCSDTTKDVCDRDCDCKCHERFSPLNQLENYIASVLQLPRRQ